MFPILKRPGERIAIEYLAARVAGAVFIAVMVYGSVLEVPRFDLLSIHAIPGGRWELFVGVWLIARGFDPSAFVSEPAWRRGADRRLDGARRRGNSGEAATLAGSRPSLAPSQKGVRMNPQKIARVTGILFLITFITAIPPFVFFYVPVMDDPRYIVGAGADTRVTLGAFLELILIVANIGTAVALFPILKRVNESLALGYVTARVVESAFIAVGILSLLSVVTLRQGAAGADAASLVAVGQSLVALHDWTFLLGPGFVVGIGNGLLLGYLMYRSRLVPRSLAMLGLVGGPLIIASGTAILFGIFEAGSAWQAIATIPEFFWELSLGIWLIVRGFDPSALASMSADPADGASEDGPQPAVVPSNGRVPSEG